MLPAAGPEPGFEVCFFLFHHFVLFNAKETSVIYNIALRS
jgi:hypothetical protein